MSVEVKFKRLWKEAVLPKRGSKYAAGYDIYAAMEPNVDRIMIPPHQTVMIRTGWAMQIPEGYFGAIFARSGLATKAGLRPANCVGIIDADYRGEVSVPLHNDTDMSKYIEDEDRIAQLVIMPYMDFVPVMVDELNETERGDGGFGSSGR